MGSRHAAFARKLILLSVTVIVSGIVTLSAV